MPMADRFCDSAWNFLPSQPQLLTTQLPASHSRDYHGWSGGSGYITNQIRSDNGSRWGLVSNSWQDATQQERRIPRSTEATNQEAAIASTFSWCSLRHPA